MHREATQDDVEKIVAIGAVMTAELPHYAQLPYSPDKVREIVSRLIDSEYGLVLIIERDGEVIGGMVGMITEHWMSAALIATEMTVYVLPQYRGSLAAMRLVRHFINWAHEHGAVQINMGISTDTNVERIAAFYQRIGLRPYGLIFEARHGNK